MSEEGSHRRGSVVWAKIGNYPWWPGIVINPEDYGYSAPLTSNETIILWMQDGGRISKVLQKNIKDFERAFKKCYDQKNRRKNYHSGVIAAIKLCGNHLGAKEWNDEKCLKWALHEFPHGSNKTRETIFPEVILEELEKFKRIKSRAVKEKKRISDTGLTEKLKLAEVDIEGLCLGCRNTTNKLVAQHPYFKGSLCDTCVDHLQEGIFAFGEDGIHTHCAICNQLGEVFICSNKNCNKVYCKPCIRSLGADGAVEWIEQAEPWLCFICIDRMPAKSGLIQVRDDWNKPDKISALFSHANRIDVPRISEKKSQMSVLSLFDGIGTGLLVLKSLDLPVTKYIASEIDSDAINVARLNHGKLITSIGNVTELTEEKLKQYGPFDLLIGGSPCVDLSLVNPARKGIYSTEGTGYLFFEFYRVLQMLQKQENKVFWLFENTASMQKNTRETITRFLSCDPVVIDAAWFSAQHRARFFWGNIPGLGSTAVPNTNVTLDQHLIPDMNRKAVVQKIRTVTTRSNSLLQGKESIHPVKFEDGKDSIWVTELEKVFGFPVHYTDTGNVSLTKRKKLLGRSWSVQVIQHIFQPLKEYFICKRN